MKKPLLLLLVLLLAALSGCGGQSLLDDEIDAAVAGSPAAA